MTWINAIRERLPHRRRFWRYVSPRRRGAGLAILAILLVLAFAYWYFTNDRRIRSEAETYLSNATGWRVRIDKASFSLFGGITLQGLRMYVPGEKTSEPFFQAGTVIMRHRPWTLFLAGRLQPTDVTCLDAVVTEVIKPEKGIEEPSDFTMPSGKWEWSEGSWNMPLPAIRVRDGRLRLVQQYSDRPETVKDFPLNVAMIPRGGALYDIIVSEEPIEGEAGIAASMQLNLATGEIQSLTGKIEIDRMNKVLPEHYDRWRERYSVLGNVELKEGHASLASGAATLEAHLDDISLKLPADEGGLGFAHVNGVIVFSETAVDIREITGQIPQAGDATFRISGRYEGYDPDSELSLSVELQGFSLPKTASAAGGLAAMLGEIRSQFQPEGPMDIKADIDRIANGKILFTGTITPRGMAITPKDFPYRLEDVHGKILFDGRHVTLKKLTARHGKGTFQLDGKTDFGAGSMDITATLKDVGLDDALRAALPADIQDDFDRIGISGYASATAHVVRQSHKTPVHAKVDIVFDGRASLRHKWFPYRVDDVTGTVTIDDDRIDMNLTARRDRDGADSLCTVRGKLRALETDKPDVRVTITATNIPVDKELSAALGKESRKALTALHPSGMVDSMSVVVTQSGGSSVTYDADVHLTDLRMKPDVFPYALEKGAGSLRIQPNLITITGIKARHDKTPVDIRGRLYLTRSGFAPDLNLSATNMPLDESLYVALPPAAKQAWQKLDPSGSADVDLQLQQDIPGSKKKGLDYQLNLTLHESQIKYEEFPYRFRGVSGRAVVTPGKIVLKDMKSVFGKATTTVKGTITLDKNGETADLSVTAAKLPIDTALLSALPEEMAALTSRFKQGGTCDINFDKLHIEIESSEEPTTQPALSATTQPVEIDLTVIRPTSRPTTRPVPQRKIRWSLKGSIALDGALVDVGFGSKRLSGKAVGTGGRDKKGIFFDAEIGVGQVLFGKQEISDVSGRISKGAGSTLIRIEDLLGKAYGGRLTGAVEIRLTDPLQYGASLVVKDLQLEDIVKGVVGKADPNNPVKGLIGGTIQFKAVGTDPKKRQAYGRLRISKAKLYKLPVMLGLLHVIYLTLPSDAAFTEGGLIYELHGEKLTLQEVYLSGSALSVLGSGTIDMKTEAIDLNFLTGPPGKLTRLDNLANELLAGISRELMEVQITGSLSKPRTRTVPLRSVDAALKTLLGAGKEDK